MIRIRGRLSDRRHGDQRMEVKGVKKGRAVNGESPREISSIVYVRSRFRGSERI